MIESIRYTANRALYSTTSWLPVLPVHFLTTDCIGGYSHSIPSGFFTRTSDGMKAASNRDTAEPRLRMFSTHLALLIAIQIKFSRCIMHKDAS